MGNSHNCAPQHQPASTKLPEMPADVWVVFDKNGPDFVEADRGMANDHANDMASQFPEMGPYRVVRYFAATSGFPLLCCPCCAGQPKLTSYIAEAVIQCKSCGLKISKPHGATDLAGEQAAISAWNARQHGEPTEWDGKC